MSAGASRRNSSPSSGSIRSTRPCASAAWRSRRMDIPWRCGSARPGGLSPPAVFDLATEQTTLIVPDEAARRAWLGLLVRTSRSLLAAALPPVIAEGKAADRPTLLPLPDEVPPGHPLHARLAKLGRYGSAMCATRRGREAAEAEAEGETVADREDRLFFDYLRGDFAAARVRPRRPRAEDHHTRASARAVEPQGADPLGPGRDEPGSRGRRLPGRGRRRARPSRRGDADGPVARARARLGPALGPLPGDSRQPAAGTESTRKPGRSRATAAMRCRATRSRRRNCPGSSSSAIAAVPAPCRSRPTHRAISSRRSAPGSSGSRPAERDNHRRPPPDRGPAGTTGSAALINPSTRSIRAP